MRSERERKRKRVAKNEKGDQIKDEGEELNYPHVRLHYARALTAYKDRVREARCACCHRP